MTFAELLSTVEHTKQQLDASTTPYHKVPVFVEVQADGHVMELYPGRCTVATAEAAAVLGIKTGDTYLEFEAE